MLAPFKVWYSWLALMSSYEMHRQPKQVHPLLWKVKIMQQHHAVIKA